MLFFVRPFCAGMYAKFWSIAEDLSTKSKQAKKRVASQSSPVFLAVACPSSRPQESIKPQRMSAVSRVIPSASLQNHGPVALSTLLARKVVQYIAWL